MFFFKMLIFNPKKNVKHVPFVSAYVGYLPFFSVVFLII